MYVFNIFKLIVEIETQDENELAAIFQSHLLTE